LGSRIVRRLASRCGTLSSCSRSQRSSSAGGHASAALGEGGGRAPNPPLGVVASAAQAASR
jgi:hypothetical protein